MTGPSAGAGEADGPAALQLVVVGGGFTGAVFAIHLIRAARRPLDIVVVEPRQDLGRGIAYGTPDPAHRINVPSDRMGLFEDDPTGATRWLFEAGVLPDPASDDGHARFYVPRHAYGSFVGDLLGRTIRAAGDRVRFRHHRGVATAVRRHGTGWQVALDHGAPLRADLVALCFGHAVPRLPCRVTDNALCHPKFIPDPWAENAVASVGPTDAVLVVGTGLTMADVVASLRERGHRGPIKAVSRRGLLSRPHADFSAAGDILDGEPAPATALGLLRLIRRRVREAAPGTNWQAVADAVRAGLPLLWAALAPREKGRVLRRLLPFWEVHRFRIGPQVHAALERDRAGGGLTVERAGLAAIAIEDDRFTASLVRPGGLCDHVTFDAVVLCNGPDKTLRGNPLVTALLADGTAKLDACGLGIAVDGASRVLGLDGRPCPTLLAFGPITRGSFGEMTGAPDIASHVERIAKDLARH